MRFPTLLPLHDLILIGSVLGVFVLVVLGLAFGLQEKSPKRVMTRFVSTATVKASKTLPTER